MRLQCLILLATGSLVWGQVNFYSKEKEAALGERLAKDILSHSTVVENPAVQSYVEGLGGRLAVQFPADLTYRFTVVTDALNGGTHEPLSLPGGNIIVSTALLTAAGDEAELAGMLAHAMAHVANRDSTRQATQGQLINYGSIPLIFIGGWTGADNQGAAIPIGFRATQKTYERQADRDAVGVMSGAGFDPAALVRYVSRVQPGNERIALLEAAIRELPPSEFQRIRDQVRDRVEATPKKPPTLLQPPLQPNERR